MAQLATVPQFLARFKEFATQDQGTIQTALNDAASQMSRTVYGSRFKEAQMWLAAHKLAISPMGRSARLEADDTDTTYIAEFRRIRREVSPKFLVT